MIPAQNYYPDWLIPDLISPLLYRWLTASDSFASAQNPLQLLCNEILHKYALRTYFLEYLELGALDYLPKRQFIRH